MERDRREKIENKREKKENKREIEKKDKAIMIKMKKIIKIILSIYELSRKRVRTTTREIKMNIVYSSSPSAKQVKRASSTIISIENILKELEQLLERIVTWRILE